MLLFFCLVKMKFPLWRTSPYQLLPIGKFPSICFLFPFLTWSEPAHYSWKSPKHNCNKAPCLRQTPQSQNSFRQLNNPGGIWTRPAKRVPFPASLADWAQIRLSKVGHWAQEGLCLICAPRCWWLRGLFSTLPIWSLKWLGAQRTLWFQRPRSDQIYSWASLGQKHLMQVEEWRFKGLANIFLKHC